MQSSFLRLNYGPALGWGTSIIRLPVFWTEGRLRQGAPVNAIWDVDGPDLVLAVTGAIAELEVALTVRISPPVRDLRIIADVEATVECIHPLGGWDLFLPLALASAASDH